MKKILQQQHNVSDQGESSNSSLEVTAILIKNLIDEIQEFAEGHAALKKELEVVLDDVKKLSSIIRDSNDKPSIITRLALIEKELEHIKDNMKKIFKNIEYNYSFKNEMESIKGIIDNIKKTNKEHLQAETQGKWQLKVAMVGGLLGILTTIGNIIIAIINKS